MGWASLVAQLVKNLLAVAGDSGSIPGSGRSPGEGNGNSLQHSSLENSMDRGITETEQTVDWRATVHEIPESDTTERLTRHKEKILSFGSNMYTVSAHLILSALCTISLGSQSGMFVHTTFRNLPVELPEYLF